MLQPTSALPPMNIIRHTATTNEIKIGHDTGNFVFGVGLGASSPADKRNMKHGCTDNNMGDLDESSFQRVEGQSCFGLVKSESSGEATEPWPAPTCMGAPLVGPRGSESGNTIPLSWEGISS